MFFIRSFFIKNSVIFCISALLCADLFPLFAQSNPYANVKENTFLDPPLDAYLDARAQGMSGAVVGTSDGEANIFTNPAAIGRTEQKTDLLKQASFPNVSVAFNKYAENLLNMYLNSSGSVRNAILNSSNDQVAFLRGSVFPNVILGAFQFGILADSQFSAQSIKLTTPVTSAYSTSADPLTNDKVIQVFSLTQIGPALGVSIPIPIHKFPGLFVGAMGRFSYRELLSYNVEAGSSSLLQQSTKDAENSLSTTTGFAFDAGFLWRSPKRHQATLGLSIRNIGDAHYKAMDSKSMNEVDKMNLVAGGSIRPFGMDKNRIWGSLLSLEGNRLNDARVPWRDKMRFGGEFTLGSKSYASAPLSLRLGYNTRGVSFGATLNALVAIIEASSYVEAVQVASATILDRRYVLRLTVNLLD